MLQINNVKMALEDTRYDAKISHMINVPKRFIKDVKLVKRSIDARRKNNVHYNCAFTFTCENEDSVLLHSKKAQLLKVKPYSYLAGEATSDRVVVVGSGPAGLFCAYQLARSGQQVTLIERGEPVDKRRKDIDDFFAGGSLKPDSNIQFGEGGAGTFSDGKLTSGVKDFRKRFILETFIKHGATEDIGFVNKPHMGTDYLIRVVKNMRKQLQEWGVNVLFNTKLVDIVINNNKINSIVIETKGKNKEMEVDAVVLAIGHSARDTYEMLYQKGVPMEAKPFAVGLRIEHPQSFINQSQYGEFANHPKLPAADYKLAIQTKEKRGVYTFCMCPGGSVVNASSEREQLVVNGMSNYAREKDNANSAILVTVSPKDYGEDHPLAGIAFQRKLEKDAYALGGNDGTVPVQRVEDYLQNELLLPIETVIPSVLPKYKMAPLHTLFSKEIDAALKEGLLLMDKKIKGFASNAILSGVESRSSAPVRCIRNEALESTVQGLYPIGEGAGYAGGIMSSAIDGLKCAESILKGR